MTKVYELPNEHRLVADIDESTRVCNITETQLDSLIGKLNYYAEEQADVLIKIRDEIAAIYPDDYPCNMRIPERIRDMAVEIVEKYIGDDDK